MVVTYRREEGGRNFIAFDTSYFFLKGIGHVLGNVTRFHQTIGIFLDVWSRSGTVSLRFPLESDLGSSSIVLRIFFGESFSDFFFLFNRICFCFFFFPVRLRVEFKSIGYIHFLTII